MYRLTRDYSSLRSAGNYAYVSMGERMIIVDLNDPLQPKIIGQYGQASSLEPHFLSSPAVSETYASIPETQEVDRKELAWLSVVDIMDPTNPRKLGQAAIPGKVPTRSQPVVSGDKVYVPAGTGIAVLDVSDPSQPILVGCYDTPGTCSQVAVVGDVIYVNDSSAGVLLLKIILE